MSAKRFWCLDEYKGETSPIVDGKFAPTNGWLCDKLNDLAEENEELKTIISNHMDYIDELCIENEKLKKDLEHCANQFTNDGKNVLLSLR